MAIEKSWAKIGPFDLLQNGDNDGTVVLNSTRNLYVKQQIILQNATTAKFLEIKAILSNQTLKVGPKGGSLENYEDISMFLAVDSTLRAEKQARPSIPEKEYERSVFAEEPIVAKRTISVDELGNYYNVDNPVPTKNVGSAADADWETLVLTRDPITRNITDAQYNKNSAPVRTLELLYDEYEDLVQVVKS